MEDGKHKKIDEPPPKRKKSKREHGSSSSAAAAPQAAAAISAAPEPAPTTVHYPDEASLPHLCCSVCLSFPEAEIIQCFSGHIMCRECHERVCHEQKPTCPTCRTPLDPLKPVRNVALEQTISLLPIQCPNHPCAEKLTRGGLARHVAHECKHRPVECKYAILGCKWTGVAEGLDAHVDGCKKAEQPGWKLLKKVAERAEATAAAHKTALAEARRGLTVCDMLSSRCKNVTVSNVTLHKCSSSEHVAGKPAHLVSPAFHAMGFRWKLYTISEPSTEPPRYQALLKLCDSRFPLPVDMFILTSPGLEAAIAPCTHRHTFASGRLRTTEPVTIAEGAAAATFADIDVMQLRIGLVDRRSGRLSRAFQGQVPPGGYPGGPDGSDEGWESSFDEGAHSDGDDDDDDDDDDMLDDDLDDDDAPLSARERRELLDGAYRHGFY